jgi:G protein beta subunit-like protein
MSEEHQQQEQHQKQKQKQEQEEQQQQYYAQMQQYQQSLQNDSHSVILVTAGYDNTVRFWEALSGICSKTIKHPDSVSYIIPWQQTCL